MLRSPSLPTFFQSCRPDMPSFSRQWFLCFLASPCFGNSSAFRKVILPAVARVPKSRPPGSFLCASQQQPAFPQLDRVQEGRPLSTADFR
ncbi:hypothetical protein pipiens_015423 [Culex pipiens pipiens]|uniref:Secreted protein n=1 Tax=Culex pipiens pipiens TaxID=38569 RepID=A0ABD1CQJ6_CULPP